MGWGLWVGTLEGSGELLTWIFALRAVFLTLMSANWPLMSVNVFFVGYGVWGAPCSSMACFARWTFNVNASEAAPKAG